MPTLTSTTLIPRVLPQPTTWATSHPFRDRLITAAPAAPRLPPWHAMFRGASRFPRYQLRVRGRPPAYSKHARFSCVRPRALEYSSTKKRKFGDRAGIVERRPPAILRGAPRHRLPPRVPMARGAGLRVRFAPLRRIQLRIY